MVISLYSFLEVTLNDLCDYFHHWKKLALTLDEVKGEGIERAKLYLSKIASISFPVNSNEWNEMVKLNAIRNCIVHAQGDIQGVKSPQKLRNIVKNIPGLVLENDRFLQIDRSYVLLAINKAGVLTEVVYEKAFK